MGNAEQAQREREREIYLPSKTITSNNINEQHKMAGCMPGKHNAYLSWSLKVDVA